MPTPLIYQDVPFNTYLGHLDILRNYCAQQIESYHNYKAADAILGNYIDCIQTATVILPTLWDYKEPTFLDYSSILHEHLQSADQMINTLKKFDALIGG